MPEYAATNGIDPLPKSLKEGNNSQEGTSFREIILMLLCPVPLVFQVNTKGKIYRFINFAEVSAYPM
jgi:hypothetical protein